MAPVAPTRPELFTQKEVAKILRMDRHTVGEVVPRLGLSWRRDPTRPGPSRLLDRDDISRLGVIFNTEPDWSALSA